MYGEGHKVESLECLPFRESLGSAFARNYDAELVCQLRSRTQDLGPHRRLESPLILQADAACDSLRPRSLSPNSRYQREQTFNHWVPGSSPGRITSFTNT